MGTVIHLHAARIPTRREKQLEIQLNRTTIQLDAVISHVVTEALFQWLSDQPAPPSEDAIAVKRSELYRHYTGIALNATARKENPR